MNSIVQIANTKECVLKIIELRYIVLRKPWGKSAETATDEIEDECVNAFIEINNEIAACGRLQKNNTNTGQVRFMAVHENYQGKGLGKLVLNKLEEKASALNLKVIELQARENAVDFYKSQGYIIKEKTFKLWDIIQHYLMVKHL
jgi:N-acetylglutamate synthase-like GNAT family acetyltransferase